MIELKNALYEKAVAAVESGVSAEEFVCDAWIVEALDALNISLESVFGQAKKKVAWRNTQRTKEEVTCALRCLTSAGGAAQNCVGESCPYYFGQCEPFVMMDALHLLERE